MTSPLQPTRPLGSTGVMVPVLGYGTAPLGKPHISRSHAERCLNHAIDLGVTYLDTSPDYGSEPHVGAVMRTRRDDIFLATKVNRRSRDGVLDELAESLDRLETDHVDLIQVHAVNTSPRCGRSWSRMPGTARTARASCSGCTTPRSSAGRKRTSRCWSGTSYPPGRADHSAGTGPALPGDAGGEPASATTGSRSAPRAHRPPPRRTTAGRRLRRSRAAWRG